MSRLDLRTQNRKSARLMGRALVCATAFATMLLGTREALPQQASITEAVVEDFTDVVTRRDLRTNDFSGDTRLVNSGAAPFGATELLPKIGTGTALRLDWTFPADGEAAPQTGLEFDLFGPSARQVSYDGQTVSTVRFDEHALSLRRIDGILRTVNRSFSTARVSLIYRGAEPLSVRLELRDTLGGGRFIRLPVTGQAQRQVLVWDFRNALNYQVIDDQDLDDRSAKTLSVLIERDAGASANPLTGSLELQRVFFVSEVPDVERPLDSDLLELLEQRSWQYFVDWSSRKGRSYGLPQARSTTPDELSSGGAGFALAAWIVGAEHGAEDGQPWVLRSAAADRVRLILQALADPTLFGPEAAGRQGHHGWFYGRLGLDGTRFHRVDDAETARDERLDTQTLSPRDTAMALMGVLAAQSYFTQDTPAEAEIRTLAQQIYDRVNWNFMLNPATSRFYAGWKPTETRDDDPYEIPDADGAGHYSGTPAAPVELDAYDDGTYLLSLLAAGSQTHPPTSPRTVLAAWRRVKGAKKLVQSTNGSLQDFELSTAFLDMRKTKTRKTPGDPATWYANSRNAVLAAAAYGKTNTPGYAGYSDLLFGLVPGPGPDDRRRRYGTPSLAFVPGVEEDGTVSYPGTLAISTFGKDMRTQAAAAVRAGWRKGHWHYRFGLPDRFNADLSQAGMQSDPENPLLRTSGAWVDRSLDPIGQGLVMLQVENARSGLMWSLLKKNPNLVLALKRLK